MAVSTSLSSSPHASPQRRRIFRNFFADRVEGAHTQGVAEIVRTGVRTRVRTRVLTRPRTGSLPSVPWRQLAPAETLEARLPALIIAGFAVVLAVQIFLRL